MSHAYFPPNYTPVPLAAIMPGHAVIPKTFLDGLRTRFVFPRRKQDEYSSFSPLDFHHQTTDNLG
jgi:hypothetical protein